MYFDTLTCFTLWVLLCLENRTTLVSPGNEGLSGKMDFLNSQVVHSRCLGCMCGLGVWDVCGGDAYKNSTLWLCM